MRDVKYLVAYLEHAPGQEPERRITQFSHSGDTVAAYREAYLRWMSGSAAASRSNLEVLAADVVNPRLSA